MLLSLEFWPPEKAPKRSLTLDTPVPDKFCLILLTLLSTKVENNLSLDIPSSYNVAQARP